MDSQNNTLSAANQLPSQQPQGLSPVQSSLSQAAQQADVVPQQGNNSQAPGNIANVLPQDAVNMPNQTNEVVSVNTNDLPPLPQQESINEFETSENIQLVDESRSSSLLSNIFGLLAILSSVFFLGFLGILLVPNLNASVCELFEGESTVEDILACL